MGIDGNGLGMLGKTDGQIGDDGFSVTLAIAALEDFSSRRIEFDQTFGVKQDMGILAALPTEDVMRAKPRTDFGNGFHGSFLGSDEGGSARRCHPLT